MSPTVVMPVNGVDGLEGALEIKQEQFVGETSSAASRAFSRMETMPMAAPVNAAKSVNRNAGENARRFFACTRWSTDRQFDRLAYTAEHFHERVDGEPGGFFVHDVGHTRARNHQNLGCVGLL